MPNKNGEGPPTDAKGPKDGHGGGLGNNVWKQGMGRKEGGGLGDCTDQSKDKNK